MCILPPENRFREVTSRYYFSFTLFPQPPWKFLSRSLILPRVLSACYLMSVCLRLCGCVSSLFALCHSAEMDSLSQLDGRALSLAISWRNKGTAIRRSPWREGSLLRQSPEGPHQHWRTVLTEPLNWVQESNSWDIKPGQISCSPTNIRDPSAFGE